MHGACFLDWVKIWEHLTWSTNLPNLTLHFENLTWLPLSPHPTFLPHPTIRVEDPSPQSVCPGWLMMAAPILTSLAGRLQHNSSRLLWPSSFVSGAWGWGFNLTIWNNISRDLSKTPVFPSLRPNVKTSHRFPSISPTIVSNRNCFQLAGLPDHLGQFLSTTS